MLAAPVGRAWLRRKFVKSTFSSSPIAAFPGFRSCSGQFGLPVRWDEKVDPDRRAISLR